MTDKEQTQEDEQISKETLISLLKDKSKEIKTLTTKLQKLEEKYVKNYKETKLYKKDYESLTKFLRQNVFDKDPYLLPAFNMGEYEYDKIHELWIKRDQHQNQTLTNLLQELNQEKQEAQKKYEKMLDEAQKNAKTANQNSNLAETIKKYENQLYELNEQNQKLAEEIVESNQIIQQKSDLISQLRKTEEQFQQLKAEMLLKELQNNSQLANQSNVDKKMANSQKLNDYLKIKNELEVALDKNRVLENQLDEMKSDIQKLKQQLNTPKQPPKPVEIPIIKKTQVASVEVQTDLQQIQISLQNDIQGYHGFHSFSNSEPNSQNVIDKPQTPQNQENYGFSEASSPSIQQYQNGNQNSDSINHEYLKNVILKYFIYQEGRYYNEASLLMSAIMTILKMSKEDREKVYAARSNATLWNSTKNFISSTFTFGQGQQDYDYTKK